MPIPTITLEGGDRTPVGTPLANAAGTIELTLTDTLVDPVGNVRVHPTLVTITLSAGSFSQVLACTSGGDITPAGVRYKVVERISGARHRQYYIALPSSLGASVNLADLVPVPGTPQATWTVPDLTAEQVYDAIGDVIVAGAGIVETVDDAANTVTIAAEVTQAELDALSGTYVRAAEPKVVIFGTSITQQGGTGVYTLDPADPAAAINSRGYWPWANAFLDQRCRLVYNAGVGGNTTTQMLARISTDVLAYDADWVVVEGGCNDIANDVASATTISNLGTIIDTLIAAGRRVCLLTPVPSSNYSTTGRKAAFSAIYKYIVDLPLTKPQVVVADVWRTIVDPATGYPATGMAIDAVHLSEVGASRAGKAIAEALREQIPPRRPRVLSLADPDNVCGNPAFTSGTGWSALGAGVTPTYASIADRWSSEAVLTLASVADDDERGIQYIENISSGRFAVGDVVQMSARFVWSGLVPRNDAFRPFMRLLPRKVDNSFGTAAYGLRVSSSEEVAITGAITSGDAVLMTTRLTLPANTDRLYIAVGWQGASDGEVRVSDLAVWKNAA